MGRDDARAIPGLQGGRAPARAFADFMKVAVAKRPVEQFETEVTLPEFQIEPDDEAFFGMPDERLFNPDGTPVEEVADPIGDLADTIEAQPPPPPAAPPRVVPPPVVPPRQQAPRTSLGNDFLSGVEPQRPAQQRRQ